MLGKSNPTSPLIVRASSLRQNATATDLSFSALGRIRGVLINQLLRLHCVGEPVDHAFEEAVLAWRGRCSVNELLGRLEQMDNDERARLATDVTAHSVTLLDPSGPLLAAGCRAARLRATQRLAGGNVVLRDVIDLMIGTHNGTAASVVLLDVTTSPLDESAERTMRYHALVRDPAHVNRAAAHLDVLHGDWRALEQDVDDETLDALLRTRCWTLLTTMEEPMTTLAAPSSTPQHIMNEFIDESPEEPSCLTDDHRRLLRRASVRWRAPSTDVSTRGSVERAGRADRHLSLGPRDRAARHWQRGAPSSARRTTPDLA